MPHNDRPLMHPPLINQFEQVFEALKQEVNGKIIGLKTTGGVDFSARAAISPSVGPYIELPHNNRIYPCCWGNTCNHMGKQGQRIGQYARSLDAWYQELGKSSN